MSHAVGARKDLRVHHGTLNGVILPTILRFNKDHVGNKYKKIAKAMNLNEDANLAEWSAIRIYVFFSYSLCLCLLLRQQPMTLLTFGLSLLCSLADNRLQAEGCKAVAAVLDKTQITSLKCASPMHTPPSA